VLTSEQSLLLANLINQTSYKLLKKIGNSLKHHKKTYALKR
jgi:hypothetical protein